MAAAVVVAGILCAVFVPGVTGTVLAYSLILAGLGGALLLVFYEVGLSEDHARAREEEERRRQAAEKRVTRPRPRRLPRRPRRPG